MYNAHIAIERVNALVVEAGKFTTAVTEVLRGIQGPQIISSKPSAQNVRLRGCRGSLVIRQFFGWFHLLVLYVFPGISTNSTAAL